MFKFSISLREDKTCVEANFFVASVELLAYEEDSSHQQRNRIHWNPHSTVD